jgi:murein DD-endopeptidase MepM/ murein hydrolase activator NlpD
MSRSAETWPSLRPDRRQRLRPYLVLLFLPLLAGIFVASPPNPVHADELADAQAEQAKLKGQIANQKAEVAKLAALQKDLQGDIAATRAELGAINVDLTAVREQIGVLEVAIATAQEEYEDLVRHVDVLELILGRVSAEAAEKDLELRRTKAQLADRIRAAYEADRTTMLETFLSGSSFTDMIVEASYQIEVGDENRALADRIVEQQGVLATLHATVSDTQAHTEALRDETAARKVQLDADKADLDAAKVQLEKLEKETAEALAVQKRNFEKLAQSKEALEKSIAQSSAAQKKLEAEIQKLLRERQNTGSIPSQYNGTFQWPLGGNITQNFGCTGFSWEPPRGNCAHFHSGIDIAAPMYTPIRSAGAGTVLFAGPNPYDPYPKAWIVIVAHSTELISWYAHVDNASRPPAVRAGDAVRGGEILAYVGMTGRTTGPHLHWMVEFKKEFVNPRLFL